MIHAVTSGRSTYFRHTEEYNSTLRMCRYGRPTKIGTFFFSSFFGKEGGGGGGGASRFDARLCLLRQDKLAFFFFFECLCPLLVRPPPFFSILDRGGDTLRRNVRCVGGAVLCCAGSRLGQAKPGTAHIIHLISLLAPSYRCIHPSIYIYICVCVSTADRSIPSQ